MCIRDRSGLWDVTGNGMEKIADAKLARALLDKVNDFNVKTGLKGVALTLAFAATAFFDV